MNKQEENYRENLADRVRSPETHKIYVRDDEGPEGYAKVTTSKPSIVESLLLHEEFYIERTLIKCEGDMPQWIDLLDDGNGNRSLPMQFDDADIFAVRGIFDADSLSDLF
ncbi:hypothetical protein [Halococcus sp. IIIV-5B]|uniref:hypothetical protein n=1 Tax=Halococcus sp. IIIV-5B TaxID=2321230 RepID=UPI000E7156CB|nr:hypothetical protein [Halococcus sp. IIIV-5B]RJT03890.1 hypothetical protein D3261_10650 [Halococcus sp. IIIV-5B]